MDWYSLLLGQSDIQHHHIQCSTQSHTLRALTQGFFKIRSLGSEMGLDHQMQNEKSALRGKVLEIVVREDGWKVNKVVEELS